MGYAIYFALYILNVLILQVFFVFKCFSVPSSKKKCFLILIIYTIVFYSAEFITYGPDPAHMSLEMYVTNSVIHAFNTFILIAILAVFTEGYLPRNFIKLAFYYDILSVATGKLTFGFLQNHFITSDMNVSASVFCAHTVDDAWLIIPYYLFLIILIITALLFNKALTRLLEKIPDNICLLVFIIGFVSFIATRVAAAFMYDDIYGAEAFKSGSYFYGTMILMTLMAIMLFIFIFYSKNKLEYQKIQALEKSLQYSYYNSAAQIDKDIRLLRHDLANHLAATKYMTGSADADDSRIKYINTLSDICYDIDSRIQKQTGWRILNAAILSNREKYEIYQYINSVAFKYKTSIDSIRIDIDGNIDSTTITAVFPSEASKKMHPFFLKRSLLFKLMATIVTAHQGNVSWRKGGKTCNFYIHLQ